MATAMAPGSLLEMPGTPIGQTSPDTVSRFRPSRSKRDLNRADLLADPMRPNQDEFARIANLNRLARSPRLAMSSVASAMSRAARSDGLPTAKRASGDSTSPVPNCGAAIGRNPVSFVVPCHRALGKSGTLTGYHWGITRKQAMLGWEAGQVGMQ